MKSLLAAVAIITAALSFRVGMIMSAPAARVGTFAVPSVSAATAVRSLLSVLRGATRITWTPRHTTAAPLTQTTIRP